MNQTIRSKLFHLTFVILAAIGSGVLSADVVVPVAQPFPLSSVRLLAGPFQQALERNRHVLLQLDPERLLHTYRLTAGLPSTAKPYGGWEGLQVEVRGHTLGHYLSACSLTYAATGDADLKSRTRHIVEVLAECQQALPKQGAHPGFLAAFPESYIDRVESGQRVWAPWYTLHKILAGLLDVHQYCDNDQALQVACRMADWVKFRMDRLSEEQRQKMLSVEFGGMGEALANLYAVSGNPEHLRLARCFDHRFVFDPLAAGEDRLDGLHANTQIPKAIAAAREYELTGETRYHDIARFFWERVALHRSYVIGGDSDREHFFPPAEFGRHLTAETAETCNTYNMLKLTRHLFAWQPSATTMDFYERALYNHILASQDPKRGMFVYLMSLKPGHFKSYSTLDNSFWCCFGTGMENHAKYGDTIFFHGADALYVNLFIPAELTWQEKNLVVRQETKFPEEETTRLSIRAAGPTKLKLLIRRPAWADRGIDVKVNGKTWSVSGKPGCYVTIDRTWNDGDVVDVRLPMHLRSETLPYADHEVAFLYGPIVLAGDLGTEGLDKVELYVRNQLDCVNVPTPRVPTLVAEPEQLLAGIVPVPDQPLTFRTQNLGHPRDVTLVPFYRMHYHRYSVYWECYAPAKWEQVLAERAKAEAAKAALERRTVDHVRIGDAKSEREHQLRQERSNSGGFQDRRWRHAIDGGWFSYDLKVLPDVPLKLMCTYWGSDNGPRLFDILVNDRKIGEQKLANHCPGEFFDESYPIPPELTRGRPTITVRFQARPGMMAGGVFDLRIIRQAPKSERSTETGK